MSAQQNVVGSPFTASGTFVKNTFLEMTEPVNADAAPRRCKSLPPSQRFFIGDKNIDSETPTTCADDASTDWYGYTDVESPAAQSEDASSDVRTESSDEDDASLPSQGSLLSGGRTCNVAPFQKHGNPILATSPPPRAISGLADQTQKWPRGDQSAGVPNAPLEVHCPPCSKSATGRARVPLRANANAFKPRKLTEASSMEPYADEIEQVVRAAEQALAECNYPTEIQCFPGQQSWNILIKLQSRDPYHSEHLLTVAKGALLDACEFSSKSIFVMGYRAPQPFVDMRQGFEATLGAMGSAPRACWHVFKKGFCRHGSECNKEHPASLVPVSVYVEHVSPIPKDPNLKYKQQVADAVQRAAAEMSSNPYTLNAKAIKIASSNNWAIEATVQPGCEYVTGSFEHICYTAKEALISALQFTENVVVMGSGSKLSFVQKHDGFEVTLGGLKQKSNACWDLCTKGLCRRDFACSWEHPEFYLKVSVYVVSQDPLNHVNTVIQELTSPPLLRE